MNYHCTECDSCQDCHQCVRCERCVSCAHCEDCQDCYKAIGLKGARHVFHGVQLTEQEYRDLMAEMAKTKVQYDALPCDPLETTLPIGDGESRLFPPGDVQPIGGTEHGYAWSARFAMVTPDGERCIPSGSNR